MAENTSKSEKLSLYIGLERTKLDSKHRVSVPAAFRKAAIARNTLHNYAEREVLVFADPARKRLLISDAATFLAKISNMPEAMGDASQVLGFSGRVMSFDDQGRVLLPKSVLKVLSEEPDSLKQLVFAGGVEFFEVYAPDQWDKEEGARAERRDAVLDHLTR